MSRTGTIKRFWILTAIVVLAQLLVVQAMAASGSLHKRCHDHADEDDHQCAVTLLLNGGYDTVVPTVTPVGEVADPPLEPVAVMDTAGGLPSHLIGGVLAQAPPRGP